MTMPALLEVRDLRTQFVMPQGPITVVDGVSFDLEAGETLAVVGESGCGKSVTALSLLRILPEPQGRVASGTVRLDGRDLLALSEDAMRGVRGDAIAMIFQEPMTSLNPVRTIGDQIIEALRAHRPLSRREAREQTVELLTRVRIPDARQRLDEYPHRLSGGMRQRVMIAMALACRPKLLIADEPTTALDVTIQAQILSLLQQLQRRARHGDHADHPQFRRRRQHGVAGGGDVCRPHRRGGAGRRPVRAAVASLYRRPARRDAAP